MAGWIKLHRSMLDWEWYDDFNTCRLFVHCLLKANHKEKKWKGISIPRGSFFTSLDSLSNETGLSKRQIRTSLDKLFLTGELTGSKHPRGRMIAVSGYDLFQDSDTIPDRVATVKRQGSDTNQECNNVKNKEISSTSVDCPHQRIIDSYHKRLPTLRKVKVWNEAREKLLRSRWRESEKHQSIEFWDGLFDHVGQSSFLTGDVNGFQADLEWIVRPTNFIKIIEGKYHNDN